MSFEDRVKDWCGEFLFIFEMDATEEESGLKVLQRLRDSGSIPEASLEPSLLSEERLRSGDPDVDEALIRFVKQVFDSYGMSTISYGTDMIGGLMVLLRTARD